MNTITQLICTEEMRRNAFQIQIQKHFTINKDHQYVTL